MYTARNDFKENEDHSYEGKIAKAEAGADYDFTLSTSPAQVQRRLNRPVQASSRARHAMKQQQSDGPDANEADILNKKKPSKMFIEVPSKLHVDDDNQQDLSRILHSNDTQAFPALRYGGRYKLLETLQHSLFGSVKVAFDSLLDMEVAIKISAKSLAAHGRTRTGAKVLENVKREANVMRYISSFSESKPMTGSLNKLIGDSETSIEQIEHDYARINLDSEIAQQHHDNDGRANVCALVEELEDEFFHYLITEFLGGGDLHSLLISLPDHRVNEDQGRFLFRQLVQGVQHIHKSHVAHLDLSLENVCVSKEGSMKIIDFGVAVIHPLAPKKAPQAKLSPPSTPSMSVETTDMKNLHSGTSSPRSTSSESLTIRSTCAVNTAVETINQAQVLERNSNLDSDSSRALSIFLCSPVTTPGQQPGKVGYMSPELYGGRNVWDAYSNDIFALGVILYCLLTGRPPFVYPSKQDPWFNFVVSGQWLKLLDHAKKLHLVNADGQPNKDMNDVFMTKEERQQFHYVFIYSHLSPSALHLIDSILKPQGKRLTLEQILEHPWLRTQSLSK